MARKSKSEPSRFIRRDSELAVRARRDMIIGALSLVAAVILTWWSEMPLSFNADSPAIIFVVFLVPFGVLYLALGFWAYVRNRKSGGAWLEHLPVHSGNTFTGFVRLNQPPDPLPDFSVTLLCLTRKYDDSSADGASRRMGVTWKKEVVVKAASVRSNSGIPLSFVLPPYNHAGPVANREWKLQVRAPLPGLNFYQEFKPRPYAR